MEAKATIPMFNYEEALANGLTMLADHIYKEVENEGHTITKKYSPEEWRILAVKFFGQHSLTVFGVAK